MTASAFITPDDVSRRTPVGEWWMPLTVHRRRMSSPFRELVEQPAVSLRQDHVVPICHSRHPGPSLGRRRSSKAPRTQTRGWPDASGARCADFERHIATRELTLQHRLERLVGDGHVTDPRRVELEPLVVLLIPSVVVYEELGLADLHHPRVEPFALPFGLYRRTHLDFDVIGTAPALPVRSSSAPS